MTDPAASANCDSTVAVSIGRGYPALADGHQRALAELAGRIAAGIDAVHAGRAADARLQDLHWPLDLCLLGMGADGHTASIFPGPDLTEALTGPKERRALGVMPDPLPPEAPVAREIAAGEEARGEREHGSDVDPVHGLAAREQLVLDRPAQRQRQDGKSGGDRGLDRGGAAEDVACGLIARSPTPQDVLALVASARERCLEG